jgi:C-terminal processing protease CtpA/Prc
VPTFAREYEPNWSPDAIARLVPGVREIGDGVWSGRIGDGDGALGYLQIRTLRNESAGALAQVPDVLDELRACRGLVLDLRMNGGGNEALAWPIAAWFVDGQPVYAQTRTRDPDTGRWTVADKRRVAGNRPPKRFAGKVAVLIGPQVLSSAEAFALMMRQAENATTIGARTGGSSGNPQAHGLPNGLRVFLPSWQACDADGVCFEGKGIAADIEVAVSREDLAAERDPVLHKAIELLREGR